VSGAPEPRLLARFEIPGEAAGKKTSGRVTYPGLLELRLQKTENQLFRARQRAVARGRSPKRVPRLVSSPADLVEWASQLAIAQPARVERVLREAVQRVAPRIQPPTSHRSWHRKAMKLLAERDFPRPLCADSHLVRVEVVVYMGQGQRGDLINFEEAVWDLLEEAGLLASDAWINSHGDSRRDWTRPWAPGVEIAVHDLGPRQAWAPAVTVYGLAAAGGGLGPIRFEVKQDGQVTRGTAAKDANRAALLRAANLAVLQSFGVSLEDGAEIHCEVPDEQSLPLPG